MAKKMSALIDKDLNALLAAGPSLSDQIPPSDPRVNRATLDLSVGRIYQPEQAPDQLGGVGKPRTRLNLEQGQTALVETLEHVNLPSNVIAIGFPPASVTTNGLLMINPGVIDPGYSGPLRCTVINMGKTPYLLENRSRILRLVFFRLSGTPSVTGSFSGVTVDEELMERLCKDFMNVEAKAINAAKREIAVSQIRGPVLMAGIAIVASLITTLITQYYGVIKSEDKLVATLTAKVNDLQVDKIRQLQIYLDQIKARNNQRTPTGG